MPTPEPSKPRGRPPGEDSPETLLRRELIAHLKLYRRTREIVEQRLSLDDINVDDLTKYMELLRKGIVEMSKPIVPNAAKAESRPEIDTEDPEKILERLIGGGR